MLLELSPAAASDLESLVLIRIEAMRESLERIGRFDPARARERLESGYVPEHTRHIVLDGERIGFVAVKPQSDHLLLDHLYINPAFQGRGIGGETLRRVLTEADARGLPVKVVALRGSDANRFYAGYGFLQDSEGEWDIHYLRPIGNAKTRI